MALEIEHDVGYPTLPAPPLRPLPPPTPSADRANAEELFRWARFLELDGGRTVSRRRAVEALLDAADHDWDVLHATRVYALKAMHQGVATRGVLDLVQEALDAVSG